MSETEGNDLNEDLVQVGDYLFSPNVVPSIEQIEEAEMFVFSHPAFAEIEEEQRRRNVIRLVIDSVVAEQGLESGKISQQTSVIPLIGGVVITATYICHEGVVVKNYEIQE